MFRVINCSFSSIKRSKTKVRPNSGELLIFQNDISLKLQESLSFIANSKCGSVERSRMALKNNNLDLSLILRIYCRLKYTLFGCLSP